MDYRDVPSLADRKEGMSDTMPHFPFMQRDARMLRASS
jgi:uncharacterized ferredoxin-like protein